MMTSRHTAKGFTLIELIVSVGLFMIVVTIAMTAYLSLISLDRKARAVNDVVTNLSFVIDTMSRSIRTGSGYRCNGTGNCWPSGASSFTFTDENGLTTTYLRKTDNTIGACVGSGACTTTSASSLTDSRVVVTNLTFYTQGVGTGDGMQPRVVFTMTGTITPEANATPISFTIESSATQRVIEI